MSITTTCASCGAEQPLTAGLLAAELRQAWEAALALGLEAGEARIIARYLEWLAPAGKAPQGRKVARCLHDLSARMTEGAQTRRGETRPAPRALWLQGMEMIVDGQTDAERPLASNAYLAGIVWHKAEHLKGRRASASPVPATTTGEEDVGGRAQRVAVRVIHQEIESLRRLLSGAVGDGAEALRRQIADKQTKLQELTGDPHGTESE